MTNALFLKHEKSAGSRSNDFAEAKHPEPRLAGYDADSEKPGTSIPIKLDIGTEAERHPHLARGRRPRAGHHQLPHLLHGQEREGVRRSSLLEGS